MNCEEMLQRLSEFLDGELPPAQEKEVRAHLDGCPRCRHEQGVLERITTESCGLPLYAPGDATILSISRAIHEADRTPPRTEFGPVLTLDDLCEYLRTDRTTIGRHLSEIPCFELGGQLLFRRKSIEEWIEQKEKSVTFQVTAPTADSTVLPEDAAMGGVRWTL